MELKKKRKKDYLEIKLLEKAREQNACLIHQKWWMILP